MSDKTSAAAVDPAVADLAASFLEDHAEIDTEDGRAALASEIQRAIEEWIEDRLGRANRGK
jgi:hypothetical protein